jgi:hypothetical protein
MSDFATMCAQIAYEMARGDIMPAIERSVQDAILHFQPLRTTWGEKTVESCTAPDKKFYDLPDDYVAIQTVKLLIFNSIYPLNPRDWDYLEKIDWGHNYWKGQPQDYATWAHTLRLYPIPYDRWPLFMSYYFKRAVNDCFWYTTAEELIRNRAKYYLYMGVLFDQEAAMMVRAIEGEALQRLDFEYTNRASTGRIHAATF